MFAFNWLWAKVEVFARWRSEVESTTMAPEEGICGDQEEDGAYTDDACNYGRAHVSPVGKQSGTAQTCEANKEGTCVGAIYDMPTPLAVAIAEDITLTVEVAVELVAVDVKVEEDMKLETTAPPAAARSS